MKAVLATLFVFTVIAAPATGHTQRTSRSTTAPGSDAAVTTTHTDVANDTTDGTTEDTRGAVDTDATLDQNEERSVRRVMPDASEPEEPPDRLADEAERTGATEGRQTPTMPSLAVEIGALSDRACLRALTRSHVAFERVHGGVPGIATPVTLTGPLQGVWLRGSGERHMHETMDCRLAVALVRFAQFLHPLGVRGLRHISLYRAPSASQLENGTAARHGVGLAADISAFVMDDNTSFVVARDFHGRRRRPVCGPTARVPNDGAARALRTFFCEAARRGVFSILLSPNFNRAHYNHFHLEISRRASWQFVR